MQLLNKVKNCNGCSACVVACKDRCVKMFDREDEAVRQILENAEKPQALEGKKKVPKINEGGCNKCNACVLFCPIFNPVDMPEFSEWYNYDEKFEKEDLPAFYRETMRNVRAGQHTEFVGTLCEIAALISLMGNKIRPNLILKPLVCDEEKRSLEECCKECSFYK